MKAKWGFNREGEYGLMPGESNELNLDIQKPPHLKFGYDGGCENARAWFDEDGFVYGTRDFYPGLPPFPPLPRVG